MLQNAANGNIFLFSLDFIYFDYIHVCIYMYTYAARARLISLSSPAALGRQLMDIIIM